MYAIRSYYESGTEPLIRIMLEGKIQGQIEEYANKISQVIVEGNC